MSGARIVVAAYQDLQGNQVSGTPILQDHPHAAAAGILSKETVRFSR
jgi:hypothetical protein